MNTRMKWLTPIIVTLTLAFLWWGVDSVLAQRPGGKNPSGGSPAYTFTYQGRLMDGGAPANGTYDFRFSVFDSEVGGTQLGSTIPYDDWLVTNGIFTVYLAPDNLNNIFTGDPRWLQVDVRPGASIGAYTSLPRQVITGAPDAWGLRAGAVISTTPTAWDGWLFRTTISGTYPAASGILATASTGTAVNGNSLGGNGLYGYTNDGYAVYGYDGGTNIARGYGGYFYSANGVGVLGYSDAPSYYTNKYAPGVMGRSNHGVGVYGVSTSSAWPGNGVVGESSNWYGVSGTSDGTSGIGIFGNATATTGSTFGVDGISRSTSGQGGHFVNTDTSGGGSVGQVGVWAGTYWGNLIEGWEINSIGNPANLRFRVRWDGAVYSDGSYNCGLPAGSCFNSGIGADVAERIDTRAVLEAGDVVEIDPDTTNAFRLSLGAYSTLVAGVVSTNPAITMNNNDLADNENGARTDHRPLLALVGQVPVKVTAENGAIQPGDLLVASSTPGHAMRAGANPPVGAVIGKALEKWDTSKGAIKMLVMLR